MEGKNVFLDKSAVFVGAVFAGICIGLGGVAFLAIDNKIIGSLFFALGLFTILVHRFNLFTGKMCYIFENKPSYIFNLLIIWIGNIVGTYIVAKAVLATRMGSIAEKAMTVSMVKLNDTPMSIFILSILCNILVFIAVDGFKNNEHELGKYIGIFVCVAGFILCGYEHCVANMFYFSVAGVWSKKSIIYMLIMTLGNSVGGVMFPLAKKYISRAGNV